MLYSACDALHWGVECANDCTCSANVLSCDPMDGCVTCLDGWTGGFDCPDDINECNETTELCGSGGTCINMPGTYFCNCDAGYVLNSTLELCEGIVMHEIMVT